MGYAVRAAKEAGAKVALNPSPINENLASIPMDLVDYFLVNEIEGKEISGAETEEPEIVMEGLKKKFPNAAVVLTLGDKGSWYFDRDKCIRQEIYKVKTVDTTAAGDTFCGYFLSRNHKKHGNARDLKDGQCGQRHRGQQKRRRTEHSDV